MDDRNRSSLFEEAMHLPPEERELLANDLYQSLEDRESVRDAWKTEAKQRLDEHRRGEGTTLTREESMADLRRMIDDSKRIRK